MKKIPMVPYKLGESAPFIEGGKGDFFYFF